MEAGGQVGEPGAREQELMSQMAIYGKSSAALGGGRGRKGRDKKKKAAREPDEEPEHKRVSVDEAERRRASRARKAEELKRSMEEDEEEESLAERLGKVSSSKSRRSRKKGELDTEPYSVTLWVYILFGIVFLDRSVKFISAHGNPVVVSKIVGTILIVAAFGVKVPQILAILKSKSVTGLSPVKFYTGVISLTLVVVYHVANRNSFTAWGDGLAVLLQDVALVGLIWHFSKTSPGVQAGLGSAYVAFTVALAVGASKTRPDKLWALPLLSTVIAHSGTIPQILDNERNKHTGPLSFVTQLMLTLGSLARVFTTLSEMNDPVVLGSFVSSVFVQGTLLVQIIMYWKNTKKVLAKEARKSKRRGSS